MSARWSLTPLALALALALASAPATQAGTVRVTKEKGKWTLTLDVPASETVTDFHIFVPEDAYDSRLKLDGGDGWSSNKKKADASHDNNGDGKTDGGDRGHWLSAWANNQSGAVRGGSKTLQITGSGKALQDLGKSGHWYATGNRPGRSVRPDERGSNVLEDGDLDLPSIAQAVRPNGTYVATLDAAAAAGLVRYSLLGLGRTSGEVFYISVTPQKPMRLAVTIPAGSVLVPTDPKSQTMLIGQDRELSVAAGAAEDTLEGYCLEKDKRPPAAASTYALPGPKTELPPLAATAAELVRAGHRLSKNGRLHTDMPPKKYRNTVIEWAIWTAAKEGTPEAITKQTLKDYVQKQVRRAGKEKPEAEIDNLVEHLWTDIDLTRKEAKGK